MSAPRKKKSAIKPRNAVTRDSVNSEVTWKNWKGFTDAHAMRCRFDQLKSRIDALEREIELIKQRNWGEG